MSNSEENILNIISEIRSSFGSSVAVYRYGNCYQFYEILKAIFPEAKAYYSGGHVWTKINGQFYDIMGKHDAKNIKLRPVTEDDIISLTQNKWTDQRRKEFGMGK